MHEATRFFAHAQNDTGWPIHLSSSAELVVQYVGINGVVWRRVGTLASPLVEYQLFSGCCEPFNCAERIIKSTIHASERKYSTRNEQRSTGYCMAEGAIKPEIEDSLKSESENTTSEK